ncbi:MAG: hypothetical protein NTV49_02060 [Kiritimatiellaeota bacterium]|nr:hypothetical protein [Kiritimatiellota bacterium]
MRRFISSLILLAGLGPAYAAPAEGSAVAALGDMKRQFETAIKETLRQGSAEVKALQKKYSEGLDRLESDLQDQGELKHLIILRDEKRRFLNAPEIPDDAVVSEPEALHGLQTAWQEQMTTQHLARTSRILDAGAKYMRQLSALQKKLVAQMNAAGVEAVKAEKDRLLDDNFIREALASKSAATEMAPVKVACYAPGKEPPVAPNTLHALQLNYASSELKAAAYYFSLTASLYSKVQQVNPDDETKSSLLLIPRITLTSKNNEMPERCKLVLEYFSRRAGDGSGAYRRDVAEHMLLPKLMRSQTVVFDGDGVPLAFHATTRKTASGETKGGREFYGLIISLFTADGKLLFQQCTPSSLIKECTNALPGA